MGMKYIVFDGERLTLDSTQLNYLLNQVPDNQVKREIGLLINRKNEQAFKSKPADELTTVWRRTSKKPQTKIFIKVGSDTVPSEYTVKVLLRIFENYCNHFHKAPYAKIENGKIKFYFEGVNKR